MAAGPSRRCNASGEIANPRFLDAKAIPVGSELASGKRKVPAMNVTRRSFAVGASLAGIVGPLGARAAGVGAEEARAIPKEAYIYGEPIVDNYRVQYAYFVDRANPEFKAPWNHIWNSARLFTPADKAIQTPN